MLLVIRTVGVLMGFYFLLCLGFTPYSTFREPTSRSGIEAWSLLFIALLLLLPYSFIRPSKLWIPLFTLLVCASLAILDFAIRQQMDSHSIEPWSLAFVLVMIAQVGVVSWQRRRKLVSW